MLKQSFKDNEDTLHITNEAFVMASPLYTITIQILVTRLFFKIQSSILEYVPQAKVCKQDPFAKDMKRLS